MMFHTANDQAVFVVWGVFAPWKIVQGYCETAGTAGSEHESIWIGNVKEITDCLLTFLKHATIFCRRKLRKLRHGLLDDIWFGERGACVIQINHGELLY